MALVAMLENYYACELRTTTCEVQARRLVLPGLASVGLLLYAAC